VYFARQRAYTGTNRIREEWNGPIIAKGMHTAEDAHAWAAPAVSFTRMPRQGLSSENGHETVLAVLGEKKRTLLERSTVS
jgi:hypothetical protein